MSEPPVVSIHGGVRTCRPSADCGSEMVRKRWVDTLDARENIAYTSAHRFARALRLVAESALAAAESGSRPELAYKRFSFSTCPFGPARVDGYVSGDDLRIQFG